MFYSLQTVYIEDFTFKLAKIFSYSHQAQRG